jgi:hypothetical protein
MLADALEGLEYLHATLEDSSRSIMVIHQVHGPNEGDMSTRNSEREITQFLHLQREAPLAFWLRRAHEQARQLNLLVDFLGEAIGIVAKTPIALVDVGFLRHRQPRLRMLTL